MEIAPGVVPEGQEIKVGVGEPLGQVNGVLTEEFGAPVMIDHDQDLQAPVRLSWDVSNLSEEQRASLLLVRWDPDLGVWAVASEDPVLAGDTLVAEVTEFSVVTWVSGGAATIVQTVGQWTGKRTDAPKCSGDPLPGWVRSVIRPDENQPAMPIRTCVEPDRDDVLTARVANNRPYTQALNLTSGDLYAWTWDGEEDFTVAGIIRDSMAKSMSNDKTLIMAPGRMTAVGLGRPSNPGATLLTIDSHPTVGTVAADVLAALLGSVFNLDAVGGFDSESINAFIQSVYDCGGKQLLQSREPAVFGDVLETVKSCGESESVRSAIEDMLRVQVSKGGEAAAQAVRTNRGLHQVMGKLGIYLTVSDFASYTAELASSAAIGDVQLTVFGFGSSPVLGVWTPTCTDPDADSGTLYQNLTMQDVFQDTSKEFWEFPSWESSSREAVKPLKACSSTHIADVAANVEQTWADQKAAAVVARSIRAMLSGSGSDLLSSTLPPNTCGTDQMGWPHESPISLQQGKGVASGADGSFGGASVMETEVLGMADMDGDGQEEAVLSLLCAGSPPEECCAGRNSISKVIGVFKLGPVLQQVGPGIWGGYSGPGDEYGPAKRGIQESELRGTTIVTTEYLLYPEEYTSEQLNGEDPFAPVTVEYRLVDGVWSSSRS